MQLNATAEASQASNGKCELEVMEMTERRVSECVEAGGDPSGKEHESVPLVTATRDKWLCDDGVHRNEPKLSCTYSCCSIS